MTRGANVHSHYAFFAICVKPIDAILQFDANANAHANFDASVNGPSVLKRQNKTETRISLSFTIKIMTFLIKYALNMRAHTLKTRF